jgi:phosphoglycerate dehydrogenase-like enzyme
MNRDGTLEWQGRVVDAKSVSVDLAWASPDLFMDGHINLFLDLALTLPGLCWLQSGAAGTDNPRFGKLLAKGVRLTTNSAPAISIAEYVLACVLDHYQRGPERRAAQRAARWSPLPFREIAGSAWLIIGFGAIGRAVAQRVRAFGAHVTGVRRRQGIDPDAEQMATPHSLPDLLPLADVVVLAIPLAADTRNFADDDFFARLKPGCVFVNVGRGLLVDETALLSALDQGRIGQAVLDVCRIEPLPDDNILWRHPKITLTAHLAGMGSGLLERSDRLFLDNLQRLLDGRPLLNEVAADAARS